MKKKLAPLKTRHFSILCTGKAYADSFDTEWLVRRRETKDDRKNNRTIDTETVIGTVIIHLPDRYHCCSLEVDMPTELVPAELIEILDGIRNCCNENEKIVFLTCPQPQEENMKQALETMQFVTDQVNPEKVLWEKPLTNWGPIFMLLGISIGTCFRYYSLSIGMCCGMAIGFAIGTALTRKRKMEREELILARKEGREPSPE